MRTLLIGGLFAIFGCPRASLAEDAPAPSVKCGAYCVFVGLKALGLVDGPYSSFEKTIPAPGPSGYSMEELDRIAKGRGAATLAVEADLEALANLSRPNTCIGFFDQHFAIIKWVNLDTKTVSLIDPPREYEQSFDAFRKRFSKRALVLGPPSTNLTLGRSTPWALILGSASATIASLAVLRGLMVWRSRQGATTVLMIIIGHSAGCDTKATPAPTPPRSPLGLKIEPSECHLGKVFASRPDRTISLENLLVNESTSPIRLLEIKKSCSCTAVALESTVIPAGGSTKLKSVFELGSRPGPNRVTVELIVGAPDPTSRTISFDWDVVTPMFADALSLDFGRLEPTESIERRVKLMDRGLATCPECRIVADPNHGLIAVEPRIERAPEPAGHPVNSESPGAERLLGSMTVSIQPGAEPGDYHQGVSLFLRCRGDDRAKLELPVDWSVRASVEAQPARLWLGSCRASAPVSRRIAVRSNDGTPLRIDRIVSKPPDFVADSAVSAGSNDGLVVDLTFSIPADPGLHRASLTISHGERGDRKLVVPVSYLVGSESPTPEKP